MPRQQNSIESAKAELVSLSLSLSLSLCCLQTILFEKQYLACNADTLTGASTFA